MNSENGAPVCFFTFVTDFLSCFLKVVINVALFINTVKSQIQVFTILLSYPLHDSPVLLKDNFLHKASPSYLDKTVPISCLAHFKMY